MAADLRKCCSEDDLPTAPWRFPLSFIPFLVFYVFFSKVRISPKVTIACNGRKVKGFQKGSPDGFYPYYFSQGSTPSVLYTSLSHSTTVNGVYVDGVSITLGEPCKHVWTYAIGLNDDFTNGGAPSYGFGYFHCPCSRIRPEPIMPA